MTPGIRPLVAGNWKMNGTGASLNELRAIGHGFMSGLDAETDALICPPATLLSRAAEVLSTTPVKVGGQDCHAKESGAHTGDISAEMLKDAGASHVIVGHSERRTDHGETDAIVRGQGRGRVARRHSRHHLHRRDQGRARARLDPRHPVRARSPARCRRPRLRTTP